MSVAKQYQNRGLTLNDLINEGNVGLVKAAKRFDETRGFKFISYAVWWIRQSILQALAEQARIVRLPLNRVGTLNKMLKAFAELEQRFQREPSTEELAEQMDVSTDEVEVTRRIMTRQISMDAPLGNTDENTLLDVISINPNEYPDSDMNRVSLQIEIKGVLATLTLREAEVISNYYGLEGKHPITLEEIGDQLGLTSERVRQIREKATRKLRSVSRSKVLRTYLG